MFTTRDDMVGMGEGLGFGAVQELRALYCAAEFGIHSEKPISINGKEHPGIIPGNHYDSFFVYLPECMVGPGEPKKLLLIRRCGLL